MRDGLTLPDLSFPDVKLGKNVTPWDLARLLYKGGAGTRVDLANEAINSGSLGHVLQERIELLKNVHEFIDGKLIAGGSKATTNTQIKCLNEFFKWADNQNFEVSLNTVQSVYIHWTDHLIHRLSVVKNLSARTAYTQGRVVGQVLDLALGRPTSMIELTRLKEPKRRKSAQGTKADKQNLKETFAFGRLLQDICDGISLDILWGPRPVRIQLQSGGELIQWAGLTPDKKSKIIQRSDIQERNRIEKALKRQAAYENDRSVLSRANLVNIRILAEMLMFIGQTGMNLAQVNTLELRHFNYASDVDGYKVRDYKSRRGGEVLFEIFKEYRSHFERYLDWRKTLFPDELRLFPLIRFNGADLGSRPCFELIQKACKETGIAWVPPSALRSTRVNWLLRQSGNADLTAEIVQHHKQTLLSNYETPSQQRAIVEITRFWAQADPLLKKSIPMISVAPGACNGSPTPVSFKPIDATTPDCIHPSGCLWCEHHRDIDSFDYVWSLSCFRQLKIVELSRYHPSAADAKQSIHPADIAITRISQKLSWFRDSNTTRRSWVDESLYRVEESSFHPDWVRLLKDMEEPTNEY